MNGTNILHASRMAPSSILRVEDWTAPSQRECRAGTAHPQKLMFCLQTPPNLLNMIAVVVITGCVQPSGRFYD